MNKALVKPYLLTLACLLLFSCNSNVNNKTYAEDNYEIKGDEAILYMNASKYGAPNPETFVYMQNKRGIRAEYNIDRSALELWISPLAGKSVKYQDRNWSNRDDHTMLFDRINIADMPFNYFDSCQYDPFHLKLYYKNNVMHLSQVYSEPSILIWFDKPGSIDFKVNADIIDTSATSLIVEEVDRGRKFEFSLFLGNGDGNINHALAYDNNRSVYARANLSAGQYVMISGELASENVAVIARKNSELDINDILNENEKQISAAVSHGNFKLNGHQEMQKLLGINKRVVHSLQDFSGMMRTTSQYIYYLLWYRDAGKNSCFLGYSGMADVVGANANVVLQNPNISFDKPKGKFFGQIMAGPLSKWEEDGLYFVVWPAFTHWTQTGDNKFTKGIYMENMEAGMKWLEDYCFDEQMGLFGRYFANETPFKGSHDFGYDLATGAPTGKWIIEYNGKTIVRTYDYYINIYNYNIYLMLSAMTQGKKSATYLAKAKALERNMMPMYNFDDNMPSYGYVETEDGVKELVKWDDIDHTDFLWPASVALFHPNLPSVDKKMRSGMYRNIREEPKGNFICAYNAVLASLDTKIYPEDSIMEALEYLVPQSIRPGKYRPMPYTIPEMVDETDGHPFHDVRPIGYSISPWIAAITNLGLKRLPFGIALRPNKSLQNISAYQYRNGVLHISFTGKGKYITSIIINGNTLNGTLQLPLNMVKPNDNIIEVSLGEEKPANLLISSTIQLNKQENNTYKVQAFGQNVVVFENLNKKITITNSNNAEVEHNIQKLDNLTYIDFEGTGEFNIRL